MAIPLLRRHLIVLHMVQSLFEMLRGLVSRGNTLVLPEHSPTLIIFYNLIDRR